MSVAISHTYKGKFLRRQSKRDKHGFLEFNSSGIGLQISGLVSFHFMGHGWLPSTYLKLSQEKKYGFGQMIPVAANDVAFSTHSVIIHSIILLQIAFYERGDQKFSKYAIGIVSVVWLSAAICFLIALPNHSWLWLISIFNSIQVCMTLIKYFPQALMNFLRKSTDGFSIGSILLDFSGGVFNFSQMAVQSIDQGSWVNFYGNIGKVMISLVTIFYDCVFMLQHYVLYPRKKAAALCPKVNENLREALISEIPRDVTIEAMNGSVKWCDQPAEVAHEV